MICQTIPISKEAVLETYIQDPLISFQTYTERPALIVCPGGAYLIHATKESEPIALDFLARGFHTFVLRYTVATDRYHPEKGVNTELRYPEPSIELLEAIHVIRQHAKEWHISDQIFLAGFSAGAHVAATVGIRWNDPQLTDRLSFTPNEDELRPAGMVLGYPMLADNPADFEGEIDSGNIELVGNVLYGTITPAPEQIESVRIANYIDPETAVPTFIWHSIDDPVVSCMNSLEFVTALKQNNVPVEYHLFSHGGHGLGLAPDDEAISTWPKLAACWMKSLEEKS